MRQDKLSKQNVILYLCGIFPVVWLGLLIAPCLKDGLPGLVQQFGSVMQNPFKIQLCEDSVKTVLTLLLVYGIAIGVYLSTEHNYRRREEHGSAKWGTAGSVNKKYANKDKTENKLLTQNVAIGLDGRKHRRNLNVLVCGGSGAGKTRFYAKPNIMNANTSFVVLDPKGELLRDTGHLLEEKGYEIKVLDLIDMEKSHCYNPFVYISSDDDIQRLTTNLFKNTTPKGSQTQDPFWDQTAAMLLKALVCYLHYEAPPDEQNFSMVMEMIRAGDVKEDNEEYQSVLDELFERLEERNPEHIALKYYRAYHSGSAKTLKSIQISLVSRLEKFNLDSLAGITQCDEMDLGQIGEKKTAVFAVIPDNDSSFNFIVGMLYTQLFQQLYYQADSVHGGRLPVHVHFVMDEFANVALPDEFDKLLSTMRSREISVSIIIQNLAQLKALFEKQWESIVGNCDEFLYLGGNEQSTHEYVSKLLGKETIDTNTYGRSRGRNGSYSTNYQLAGRELMTPDEVRMLDNQYALLFIRGERPIRDLKYIKDSMFSELTELNRNLMLSIDVIPVLTDEAVREVERLLLGVETNITGWQRRQNQNNNFSAVVPYDMELQRKESKEFLDDLTTRDQRMMFAVVTMVITADTKEQLDQDTETVLSTARKHMCQMATLKYQQTDGLNTVLPIGTRKINAFRTLTTESLAVLMPFKVQEIMDKGGIYFGENAISHNLIMCNKANLLNQSAFLLGVPGSGKSFSAKELITFLILNTNDDILICDPEGEYAPLIEAMGNLGSVIRVSAGGRDRLNAMYMVDGYGENNPIVVKSEFVMSLIEQIDKKGVGPQHKSIIDRCITNVYRNAADTGTIPTLCTLRDMLLEQPESEAKQIALSLELYTTGSLDIFGKQSNVDLDKRVVVFDIHGLGSQLKPTGLLVITDTMLNRVTLNWKKGKRTHVFIDEFHVVFENEFSAQFFNSAWRQFRKRNAYPTAITQNVEYLLDSVQASTMLSNSEFVVMLNQAASDRGQLAKLLNISNEQMSYITNADAGCGLIKYGSALVPFINRFPQDTKLYQLMTTRPGEGKFARGRD